MLATCFVIGLHVFSQSLYTFAMYGESMGPGRRALWLGLIWLVPVIGIGIAGARFSRSENFFQRSE